MSTSGASQSSWVVGGAGETRRSHLVAAGLLLLAHAVAGWRLRVPSLPTMNDDSTYLLLSRALRALHYTEQYVVGNPVHFHYPPGYPALLAAVSLPFGESLAMLHAVTILTSVVVLGLTFDLARRYAGPLPALGLLAALCLNAKLLNYATGLVAEQPYAAASIGSLWVFLALPLWRGRLWLAGALAIIAALTRSAGIAVVGAFALALLLERRWRAFATFLALAAPTVGGWLLWTAVAPSRFLARSYMAVIAVPTTAQSSLWERLAHRTVLFFEEYAIRAPLTGIGFPTIEGTLADNLFWLALLAGLVGLGAYQFRRQTTIILLYLAAYTVVIAVYPFRDTRFLMPLVPLLVLYALLGSRVLARHSPRGAAVLWGVLCFAILNPAIVNSRHAFYPKVPCLPPPAAGWQGCPTPESEALFAAARFARDSLPADAAVATVEEATFALHAGRRVLHPEAIPGVSPEQYLQDLRSRGVGFILLSAFPGGINAAKLLEPVCESLIVRFHQAPQTYLLELRQNRATDSAGTACTEVRNLVEFSRRSRRAWERRLFAPLPNAMN